MGGSIEVAGELVNGAQNIVFAQLQNGDVISPEAAKYFSFAFPMMLVGFPAAALAMYHTAKPERKADVKGLLFSSSLTSFVTGITEPIEFSILFASPVLYFGVNAVLAGLSVVVVELLSIGVGFTFSAGFLDFFLYGMLPGNERTNWIILAIYSLIWGLVYYFLFRWAITKFDLKTPGREDDEEETRLRSKDEYREEHGIGQAAKTTTTSSTGELTEEELRSQQILEGLGGQDNLASFTNCATRLRVTVEDGEQVNQAQLRRTGAAGVTVSGKSVQVIYGTQVGGIATDLEDYINRVNKGEIQVTEATSQEAEVVVDEEPKATPAKEETEQTVEGIASPLTGRVVALTDVPDAAFASEALGKGAAIEPTVGEVVSPVNGKVVTVFPTGHAIGLQTEAGAEILIHIGLDTVNLDGKGFNVLVDADEEVTIGQKLVEFDIDLIKEAGYSTITPVVVTNTANYNNVSASELETVNAGDELITID